MNDYMTEYERWLASDALSDAEKSELKALRGSDDELKSRFSGALGFGTGGLRAEMSIGSARMNVYTVARASAGLADYIKAHGREKDGVVIAYDSRINSRLFAETTAAVLAGEGVKVYFFEDIRPTPVLSYSVRRLKCAAGVNITASHNPKEYNGYKVYWDDGAQLSLEQADEVSAAINRRPVPVKYPLTFEKALSSGLIIEVGADIDEPYIDCVLAQAVDKNAIPSAADALDVVYTPLHGTGRLLVPEVLRRTGLKKLHTVSEQMVPDGTFPTVKSPNPENAPAFTLGIKLAEEKGADLVVATDPDADRVGIAARDKSGEFRLLTGNQTGAILLDYILTAYEKTNTMPKDGYVVKTIVTSEFASKICASHSVPIYSVLTGFKFIGEVIKKHEEAGHGTFLFGFEESYGYLKGTYARDKDSVVATLLICEAASYYRMRGMTLCDALDELYEKYGYFREEVANIAITGAGNMERMAALMNSLRATPPAEIAGSPVVAVRDYLYDTITDTATGAVKPTGLPRSDVLYYETLCGDVTVVRPSGTEPKVKLYFLCSGKTAAEAAARASATHEFAESYVRALIK